MFLPQTAKKDPYACYRFAHLHIDSATNWRKKHRLGALGNRKEPMQPKPSLRKPPATQAPKSSCDVSLSPSGPWRFFSGAKSEPCPMHCSDAKKNRNFSVGNILPGVHASNICVFDFSSETRSKACFRGASLWNSGSPGFLAMKSEHDLAKFGAAISCFTFSHE